MRVLMTGATGFVGRALVLRLSRDGHALSAWTRSPARARGVLGADVNVVDAGGGNAALIAAVANADAIVNLAGEPIAGGRWTTRRRAAIVDSRVGLTNQLVDAIAQAAQRPRVFLSASAVGFYGDRGDEPLDESNAPGTGFLAETCVQWEAAAFRAETLGVRVACLRLGVVMGLGGGFLGRLLPLFRMGLGARLGSGRQWMPWIHLEDLANLFAAALHDERYTGPLDAVAPGAVRMHELMDALGRAVGRKVRVGVPAAPLRLLLGEAADVVLGGQQLRGARLQALGHTLRFATIDAALSELAARATAVQISPLSGTSPPPTSDPEEPPPAYLQRRSPTHLLRTRIVLDAPLADVFAFFSRPQNLGLITPAAMAFRILKAPAQVSEGSIIDYALRIAGATLRWRTVIARWRSGQHFVDAQERGPYRCWWHEHHFLAEGKRTVVEDRVFFALPLGPFGALARVVFVARQLRDVFGHRGQAIGLRFQESLLPRP